MSATQFTISEHWENLKRLELLLVRCFVVDGRLDEDQAAELTRRTGGQVPYLRLAARWREKHGLPGGRIDHLTNEELLAVCKSAAEALEVVCRERDPAWLPHVPSGARYGWREAYQAVTGRAWGGEERAA